MRTKFLNDFNVMFDKELYSKNINLPSEFGKLRKQKFGAKSSNLWFILSAARAWNSGRCSRSGLSVAGSVPVSVDVTAGMRVRAQAAPSEMEVGLRPEKTAAVLTVGLGYRVEGPL